MKTIQEEMLDDAMDILYSAGEDQDAFVINHLNMAVMEIEKAKDYIRRRQNVLRETPTSPTE